MLSQPLSLPLDNFGEVMGAYLSNKACWTCSCGELFCLEPGTQPDGQRPLVKTIGGGGNDALDTFVFETGAGKYVPRCVTVDFEPTLVDEVRTGIYRQIFYPELLISGKEDADNNFARGHYTIVREIVGLVFNRIRRLDDKCTGLQTLMTFNAVDGGSESILGRFLLERLSVDDGKKSKISFAVWACTQVVTAVVELYNTVLCVHLLLECTASTIMFGCEVIDDVCRRNSDIERPTSANVSRLLAQVISSLTASMRLNSTFKVDLMEFQSNDKPILSGEKAYWEVIPVAKPFSVIAKCDPRRGKCMTYCMVHRGDSVSVDVNASVDTIKTQHAIQFMDWYLTGFKCGIDELISARRSISLDGAGSSMCTMALNAEIVEDSISWAVQSTVAPTEAGGRYVSHRRFCLHHDGHRRRTWEFASPGRWHGGAQCSPDCGAIPWLGHQFHTLSWSCRVFQQHDRQG